MYGKLRDRVKPHASPTPGGPGARDQPTLIVKIVFLTAGGPFGLRALESLIPDHDVSLIVRPLDVAPAWKRLARIPARAVGLRHRDVVEGVRRTRGIPSIQAAPGDGGALARALARVSPDLICIATFPWLLTPDVLAIARHGVVNLHPSLLPRHRGPNPLYWTYYHDDRSAGVSVHLADSRADAGPILVQERMDVPRGWPSGDLYLAAAALGAEVLPAAVESIARGTARPVPQTDAEATRAPRVEPGTAMIDFASWDVERVWHYLAGLHAWYREPLITADGRRVRYGAVMGFERGRSEGETGRVRRSADGWALCCRDGEVRLGRRSLVPTRVRSVSTSQA